MQSSAFPSIYVLAQESAFAARRCLEMQQSKRFVALHGFWTLKLEVPTEQSYVRYRGVRLHFSVDASDFLAPRSRISGDLNPLDCIPSKLKLRPLFCEVPSEMFRDESSFLKR
jgi:hypothetical protein